MDVVSFGFAVAFWALLAGTVAEDPTVTQRSALVNAIVGAVCCLVVWWRRRFPVVLNLVLVPLTLVADSGVGAVLVLVFTLAIHRPARVSIPVTVTGLAVSGAVTSILAETHDELLWLLLFHGTAKVAALGWGLSVRHHRQYIDALTDRAARAEVEARLRAEQAQTRVRQEIAREMHDILGHRLSLLSVHAGALEFRRDAEPEAVARAASVIRDSAHRALLDLRQVLDVLRTPAAELPQPTGADLTALIGEARASGTPVSVADLIPELPEPLGRTVYRIVQEGLTNARKHVPGVEVRLSFDGGPAEGLTVRLDNDAGSAPVTTGEPGQGLIGLTERVGLASGRMEHGPTPRGGFRLLAWLPWPT